MPESFMEALESLGPESQEAALMDGFLSYDEKTLKLRPLEILRRWCMHFEELPARYLKWCNKYHKVDRVWVMPIASLIACAPGFRHLFYRMRNGDAVVIKPRKEKTCQS